MKESDKRKETQWIYLKLIPPSKHDYYRNLRTNRHDGISSVCDQEDINVRVIV